MDEINCVLGDAKEKSTTQDLISHNFLSTKGNSAAMAMVMIGLLNGNAQF